MRYVLIFVIAVASLGGQLSAQPVTEVLPHPKQMKGQMVVYRLPMPSKLPQNHDGPWVSESGGRILLEGVETDSILGFPSNRVCKVDKVIENKKLALVGLNLECKNKNGNEYNWLFVPNDSAVAIRTTNVILAPAVHADRVMRAASDRIRRVVFTGPLASVPSLTQSFLMDVARGGEFSPYFSARQFQGRTYFRVDLGLYPSVMNSARLNMNQRISTALNSTLFTYLKAFGTGLHDAGGLEGINLRVSIGHRNFVTHYSGYDLDYVEIYMQTADIVRFYKAEITGQDLVDRSVVLVNDNRTKLVLSDAL